MRLPQLHRSQLHLPQLHLPHFRMPRGQDMVVLAVFTALAIVLAVLVAMTISNPAYLAADGYRYAPGVP